MQYARELPSDLKQMQHSVALAEMQQELYRIGFLYPPGDAGLGVLEALASAIDSVRDALVALNCTSPTHPDDPVTPEPATPFDYPKA